MGRARARFLSIVDEYGTEVSGVKLVLCIGGAGTSRDLCLGFRVWD
jgi:hypothetical protein